MIQINAVCQPLHNPTQCIPYKNEFEHNWHLPSIDICISLLFAHYWYLHMIDLLISALYWCLHIIDICTLLTTTKSVTLIKVPTRPFNNNTPLLEISVHSPNLSVVGWFVELIQILVCVVSLLLVGVIFLIVVCFLS